MMISKCSLTDIENLRSLFLHETNFQFVHDKCHLYGWADNYIFNGDGQSMGYGSVWGLNNRTDRDTIFEFYVLPPYRRRAHELFGEFIRGSNPIFIECQSNDYLLSSMFFEFSQNIYAESTLFEDTFQTNFSIPGLTLEKYEGEENRNPNDRQFHLKKGVEILGTGGLMLNYNFPYADIYYEIKEKYRGKGLGSFLFQELKKAAYAMGRVPASRCDVKNKLSKMTMLKAGMKICGHILIGEIVKQMTV